ncbi:hypothetical protein ACFCYN_20400 [Gottfriedia sp. NPDC056225]|uniref:hypothetical protein n=1 Tax=Gottfriedia sp. NPDC056225 TaxID=3345751 RepID=UPI0015593DBE|nr:hypothetical protein HPK19_07860 [Arthrobacter citreus]
MISAATGAMALVMVSISTFDWSSLKTFTKLPKTDAAVMAVTVGAVVSTHNLVIGVIIGIILSAVFFAAKISKVKVTTHLEANKRVYKIEGQLFFASVTDFVAAFNFKDEMKTVAVDLSKAHI